MGATVLNVQYLVHVVLTDTELVVTSENVRCPLVDSTVRFIIRFG